MMQGSVLQSESCLVSSFNRVDRFLDYLSDSKQKSAPAFDLILTDRFFKEEGIDLLQDQFISRLKSDLYPSIRHTPIFLWSNSTPTSDDPYISGFDKVIGKELYTFSELMVLCSESPAHSSDSFTKSENLSLNR